MNLILVDQNDETLPGIFTLRDRRARHVCEIHRAQVGDSLRVGWINGKLGFGRVLSCTLADTTQEDSPRKFTVELQCVFTNEPPPPPPIELLIALPRPKFLSRVVETATAFGIKKITFFNSIRVDKVYWSCNQLTPESLRAAALLGLEQAGDTVLPEILLRRLFKPFVEDEVPAMIHGRKAFLAHPRGGQPCPYQIREATTVVIGPEGGFIEYEVDKLEAAGFTSVELFPRVLKVETAVAAVLGRLI